MYFYKQTVIFNIGAFANTHKAYGKYLCYVHYQVIPMKPKIYLIISFSENHKFICIYSILYIREMKQIPAADISR